MPAAPQSLHKLQLHYFSSSPPIASLFCLALPRDKKSLAVETIAVDDNKQASALPRLEFEFGEKQCKQGSDIQIAAYICLSVPSCRVLLDCPPENYDKTAATFQQSVSHWLGVANAIDECSSNQERPSASSPLMKGLKEMEAFLKSRTFLVGHQLTLADISIYAALTRLFGFNQLKQSCAEGGSQLACCGAAIHNYIALLNETFLCA